LTSCSELLSTIAGKVLCNCKVECELRRLLSYYGIYCYPASIWVKLEFSLVPLDLVINDRVSSCEHRQLKCIPLKGDRSWLNMVLIEKHVWLAHVLRDHIGLNFEILGVVTISNSVLRICPELYDLSALEGVLP
jgi:hypothetical protein